MKEPSKVEQFLLIKLMEECAEVVHACSKILEHGYVAVGASPLVAGIKYNNAVDLAKELGDVIAVMHVFCEYVSPDLRNSTFNHKNIETFAEAKRKLLRELAEKRVSRKER